MLLASFTNPALSMFDEQAAERGEPVRGHPLAKGSSLRAVPRPSVGLTQVSQERHDFECPRTSRFAHSLFGLRPRREQCARTLGSLRFALGATFRLALPCLAGFARFPASPHDTG